MYIHTVTIQISHIVSPEGSVRTSPSAIFSPFDEAATFTCSSKGGPYNMFQWTNYDTGSILSNTSQLTIDAVSVSDAGQYVCIVNNDAGYGLNTSYLYSK